NTYAGNTNVNAGMLILSGGGSIASGNFNVAGGAVNVNGGGSLGSANINVNSGSLSIAPGGALTNLSPIVTVAGGASMSVAAGATIPTSLSVVDNGTVTLNGATTLGTLSGSGVVTLNGANLTIASGGTVGNVLQDGGSAGSLTVNAGSPLILTGANTYSGATAINSGATLQIGNGGATGGLAATSAITNAGTLVYNLAAPSAVTIANAIANTGTLNFNSAGDLNVTGAITGSGTLRQTGAGTTSLSGDISGFTGGITLGGGTLVFNYAAPTTVSNAIGVVAGATSAVRNVGKLTMSGVESVGSTAGAITYNVTPIAGNMPSGVPADVEITGSINRTSGSDGVGIIKTGTGTLAISGATDNASLGATVNGGTLLLNKTSATTIHAIGGGGLVINNGGTVKITGTGGEQIYNAAGTTTIADGGTFDLNGQSQGLNNMTLGNATGAGLLTTSVPGLAVVAKIGTAVGTANDAGASAAATIGRLSLGGDSNISAASGASIELQNNGLSATGGNHTLSDIGPGTVLLTGLADNSAVNVAVTSGTLVLAKPSVAGTATGSVHSASSVTGVSAGATLQLAGSGGDQLFDGFAVASGTQPDYGVLNMNGTFDMNGQSEGFDKLTGTGNVINSQSGTPVTLTLGANNGLGAATPEFDGVISGNIALIKADATTPPATEVPLILGGANTYTGNTNVSAGVLTIAAGGSIASANVVVAASANPGTLPPAVLNVNGSLASNANVTANGPVNFGGTTGATANTQALSSLAIGSGVTITITPSVGPLHPTILAPAATTYTDASSLIDITNNAFISNGSAASALVQLQTGQIFSSVAPDLIHAIGYINLSGGRFEVRYTLKGDSNLDGVVNVGDLGALATSYGITGGMSWGNGDFNRDGNVDVGDLGALATNYGSQLASGPSAESAALVASPLMLTAAPSAIAAVPEPASLGVLAISAIGILANRRRR
ncbi:MAG TPA: autotransporter-associated beta strand repeat-containing protein, partial [Tepidisphaeraceae bacterium]|nr:autotransporter-associated beta strand repeat-containing protein [Tepidisphaeraceae bacterium]